MYSNLLILRTQGLKSVKAKTELDIKKDIFDDLMKFKSSIINPTSKSFLSFKKNEIIHNNINVNKVINNRLSDHNFNENRCLKSKVSINDNNISEKLIKSNNNKILLNGEDAEIIIWSYVSGNVENFNFENYGYQMNSYNIENYKEKILNMVKKKIYENGIVESTENELTFFINTLIENEIKSHN